jgi:uncharacterized glyoxalase superfamily metalloenzyme YdcJ
MFCSTQLPIIQDPPSKISPDVLYRQVQFVVAEEDWTRASQVVENTETA